LKKSDSAHFKNENMCFYIIIKSAPISLIGTFGRRKNCKLCKLVKQKLWCKDKEIWHGAL
jgi:hypothetical protein